LQVVAQHHAERVERFLILGRQVGGRGPATRDGCEENGERGKSELLHHEGSFRRVAAPIPTRLPARGEMARGSAEWIAVRRPARRGGRLRKEALRWYDACPMSPEYIFQMQGLRKVVPPKREILKDIWLSFFFGAKIGVLGPNGAGKSSLLRVMAGDDK